jgi:17beta-estradiol 17-dehydrogenase / very-long-chain 3-oxoacyl-CoA reductase
MVCCSAVFNWIGIATAVFFVAKFATFAHQYFLMRVNLNKYKKGGSWAVVTGASDGIGKAMSMELGKRGFNVCLISRTKAKLDEVATTIAAGGVQTRTIAFDFSTAGDAEYQKLFKELDQVQVGVLVNNVGINYEFPTEIADSEEGLDMSILKVNCESQIRMTKYAATKMKEKRSGAIMNLSSISCMAPTPMLATYGATKAFNKSFSEALAVELKPYGIDVTAVTPAFVCSNMSGRKRPTFDCPSARAMVSNTLNQLGGVTHTYGHRHHGIIGAVLTSMPGFYRDSYILKTNKVVRKKAMKKKEAQQAAQ